MKEPNTRCLRKTVADTCCLLAEFIGGRLQIFFPFVQSAGGASIGEIVACG